MTRPWIKITRKLPRASETVLLARAFGLSRRETVGLLVDFWLFADECARPDGSLPGYDQALLDEAVSQPGFCAAMLDVGWLAHRDGLIHLPGFCRYLGDEHARRAKDAARQRRHRARKTASRGGGGGA